MFVLSLPDINNMFENYSSQKKWYRRLCKRSAVAIILREKNNDVEILMIKRAEHDGDPWSGQMGFPGGRKEQYDQSNLITAQRETREEIGLDLSVHASYVARLSDILARPRKLLKPMVITPYIFSIERSPSLTINYEVAEVIWIPLRFFADEVNRRLHLFSRGDIERELPSYHYEGRVVWGMSLMMIEELLAVLYKK